MTLLTPFLWLIGTLLLLLSTSPLSATGKPFTVVIDAGHGGKDHGAIRGNYREKNINLSVALKLGEYIRKNLPEVKVIFTRDKDIFVELHRRAEIANKNKADLFISIHTNSTAAKSTTATGAETYILGSARSKESLEVAKRENSVILLEDDYGSRYEGFNPKDAASYIIFEFMSNDVMLGKSREFASYVQKNFRQSTALADKGMKEAGFLVLRKTSMPSVLIELGFINNLSDARYLSSKAGQNSIAKSIFEALKIYKHELDKRQIGNNHTGMQAEEIKNASTQIEYRVQVLASPQKVNTSSSQFKGLQPIEYFREGRYYKYTYGSTTDYNEIIKLQREVRKKIPGAFVVKFKNGQRIK